MKPRPDRMHRHWRRRTRPGRRPLLEPLEPRTLLATITVNSADDSGARDTVLTLRQAIELSDGTLALGSLTAQQKAQVSGTLTTGAPGNTIAFDIPGAGVHTIKPTSALPKITAPVTIDGYTQPGSRPNSLAVGDNAVLRIELDGSGGTAGFTGLDITAGHTTVQGLVINHFAGGGGILGFGIIVDAVGAGMPNAGGNDVEGDFIGTDPTGTIAEGNQVGVFVRAPDTTIGGLTPAARNLISGNGGSPDVVAGVNLELQSSFGLSVGGDLVAGNYIGPDATGTKALSPKRGILLTSDRSVQAGFLDATIGGTTAAARNLISGNALSGVEIDSSNVPANPVTGYTVQGNFIGTDATGQAPLGNGKGVAIATFISGAQNQGDNNLIGGAAAGAGNVIAFNRGAGVAVGSGGVGVGAGRGNSILGNSIFANGIGIDLGDNGPTPNHPGGAENGPNNLQNFPVITSITSSGGQTTITGTLNSDPDNEFLIQFFRSDAPSPTSFGEGQTFIGSIQTDTDPDTGGAHFTATLPVAVSPTQFVTATATDHNGDTSEFSEVVADVGVTQSASATTAVVGQEVTFTATVTNAGPEPAPGLVLTDALPPGFAFVSATGGATPQNGPLAIPLGTLPAGSSATATVVLRAVAAGGPFTNVTSVKSTVDDHDTTNNTARAAVNVVGQSTAADTSVTVTAAPSTLQVGQELTYTITTRNAGPDLATGLVVTDTLPAGLAFVSAPFGAFDPASRRFTVALGGLANGGESITVTLTVRATAAGTITDTVAIRGDQADPNPANNTAAATVTVKAEQVKPPAADVSVAAAVAPRSATVGQALTYTFTVTNHGPDTATAVTLTDPLPAALTFLSAAASQGGIPARVRGTVTAELGPLAPGASATVRLMARAAAAGTVADTARVAHGESDPNPANDSATATVTVGAVGGVTAPPPDLAVVATAAPGPVLVGQPLAFQVTVTNHGAGPATGVTLRDRLPAGATFLAASRGGLDPAAPGMVVAALGDLAPGASAAVTIVVQPTAAGMVVDAAAATARQPNPDPRDSATFAVATAVPPAAVDGPVLTGLQRFGIHAQPTVLVLSFSGPLDPARAQDVNNYRITGPGSDPIAIDTATYDPATRTVTLLPRRRLDVHKRYRLTVVGTGPLGLANPAGLRLDGAGPGRPGTDAVATVDWSALVLPGPKPTAPPR